MASATTGLQLATGNAIAIARQARDQMQLEEYDVFLAVVGGYFDSERDRLVSLAPRWRARLEPQATSGLADVPRFREPVALRSVA